MQDSLEVKLAKMIIIFYSSGWDQGKQSEWDEVSEGKPATTKTLCDTAREVLKSAGYRVPYE